MGGKGKNCLVEKKNICKVSTVIAEPETDALGPGQGQKLANKRNSKTHPKTQSDNRQQNPKLNEMEVNLDLLEGIG